jgi:hypothetical protein
MFEIVVGREHDEVVSHAKLRQESTDRSDLCPGSPTSISQISGLDVIIAIGDKKRHCRKPIQNLRPSFRTRKALQDLLEHEARCNNRLARFNGSDQRPHFRHRGRRIAPERKRPNTCVNEKAQSRRRSAL